MNKSILFLCLLSCTIACKTDKDNKTETETTVITGTFNSEKWQVMEKGQFPFREEMIQEILYTDTIRNLKKDEIIKLLGEPSYKLDDDSFLYYTISKKTLGPATLSSKTMVIKLNEDENVDWMKLHE